MTDTFVSAELASQPETWRAAAALLPTFSDALPSPANASR